MKKISNSMTAFCLFICILIAAACYWWYVSLHPSTDNAYVKAHVVQIAPQVSGNVSHVYVSDKQTVSKGQLLFEIDPHEFKLNVQEAQAQLTLAQQQVKALTMRVRTNEALVTQKKAELVQIEKQYQRTSKLIAEKLSTQAEQDQINRALHVAKAALQAAINQLNEAKSNLGSHNQTNARILQATAQVQLAQIQLDHTTIKAPADGYISNFSLREGQKLSAFTPICNLIDTGDWWVDAHFKETQLAHIRINQAAHITIDMYPGIEFHGRVTHIGWESDSSSSLLPSENATGNWVKVTQRFPVKISLMKKAHYPFRLGASASVTLDDTRSVHH